MCKSQFLKNARVKIVSKISNRFVFVTPNTWMYSNTFVEIHCNWHTLYLQKICTCYVDIYKHAIIRKRTTIRTKYTYLLIYHVHQDYGAFWCTSTYSYIQKCKGTFHVCIRKKLEFSPRNVHKLFSTLYIWNWCSGQTFIIALKF